MYRREGKPQPLPPTQPRGRRLRTFPCQVPIYYLSLAHSALSLTLRSTRAGRPPRHATASTIPTQRHNVTYDLHPAWILTTSLDTPDSDRPDWQPPTILSLLNGPLSLCNTFWRVGFPLINIQEGGRTVLSVYINVSVAVLPIRNI